jgi:hypothetical protein
MDGRHLGFSDYELITTKKPTKRKMVLSDGPALRKVFTPLI